jgi:hypothetical protein
VIFLVISILNSPHHSLYQHALWYEVQERSWSVNQDLVDANERPKPLSPEPI